MIALLRRHADVALALACIGAFVAWPALDLRLVAPFYRHGLGFPANEVWWIRAIYVTVARTWVLALALLVLLLASWLPRLRAPLGRRRKALLYLLTSLILGPGLIVNTVLKDHWGRPRPVHLAQFGGHSTFTPALKYSTQCPRNCSFPSGHAGAAFFPMAGYWLTRQRRWLVLGIACGLLVGYTRMAMGAHFLSDVIFSGFIVHFSCRWLAACFGLHHALPGPEPPCCIDAARRGSAAAVTTQATPR